ncbi:MAG: cyclase family protein [Lachnospiraceae bacterium]|nr:cyclase family protein [Lachnospiraceae bacterium]MCM1237843.1 cyclase family protein [Lachnospiraceae bacterium]
MKIIDLSLTLDNECMTCGTPWHQKVRITQMGKLDEVGRNTHSILVGSHSGTHMDAPLHFFNGAQGIDEADLQKICGNISIVNFSYMGEGSIVEYKDVRDLVISERMLFRFDWWKNWKTPNYYKGFPFFSEDAVSYLIEKGMGVIALDTPSPDGGGAITQKEDSPVHKKLLENQVTIIEYLSNTDCLVEGKKYCLFALPLKIKNCDGAPSRVIAVEMEEY